MPKIKEGKTGRIESESITFRIEKSVLDELRSEADQKMESVNTLVNQIIKSYVRWHKPARNARLGYFPKVLMAKSMDYLTDEQVMQITEEYCNHHLKDITHMLRAANTFTAFMDALRSWLDSSGFHFRIDRFNGGETYVIQFDLGRKWSLFFKTQMKSVFEHFNVHGAEAKMTDNTVILEIPV